MYIYCLTFQITAASTVEVGVALLVIGGALYNWWNRPPTNPILPIALNPDPDAADASNAPVTGSPPSEATNEFLGVVVTDPIEQVETFLVLKFSKVPSMYFYPDLSPFYLDFIQHLSGFSKLSG